MKNYKRKIICTAAVLSMLVSGMTIYSSGSQIMASSLTGDVNGDTYINILDLNLMKSYLLGLQKAENIITAGADTDGNSIIDIKDFVLLKKYILGYDISFSAAPDQTTVSDVTETTDVLEPKGTVHTGEGTFYGGGYEGGCAMLDPVSRDYWIVAMNLEDYNNAMLAGAYLEVTGELGTINMLVTDLLPEGKKGDLDLYVDAFPLIAPAEKGRVPVSWKIVPLDTADDAPISYKYKEGTSEFWCSVQLRNHRYPVAKLEYLNKDGEFTELPRRHYNYFESREMGAGPFTFRITDIYGQSVTDYDIPLVPDGTVEGSCQLPL